MSLYTTWLPWLYVINVYIVVTHTVTQGDFFGGLKGSLAPGYLTNRRL